MDKLKYIILKYIPAFNLTREILIRRKNQIIVRSLVSKYIILSKEERREIFKSIDEWNILETKVYRFCNKHIILNVLGKDYFVIYI